MDTKKEIFLNNRFQVNKSEIELVLNEQSFKCEDAFIIDNQQMVNIPSFIFDNQELQSVLKNHDLLNKKASQLNHLSKTELRSEKSNLKEELEMLYRGCKKIFDAVGELLRHEIKAGYSLTIQNDDSKIKKIEALDSLIQKARDLVAFFGIKPDYKSASGLIYGTDVDRCLYAIRKYEALNVILQEKINDINDYRTDQRNINLKKLVELQKLAIPKAKDYVIIQHALSTLSINEKICTPKAAITREEIFIKAQELKKNGMSVLNMFDKICDWLLNDLNFTKSEIKKNYNFSLEDHSSFNKLVNKHAPYHS